MADRFVARRLLQPPLLQAFGGIAIYAMVQPAAFSGTVGPLFLGCCPLIWSVLRLRRNGCRHENRQGNREHPEISHQDRKSTRLNSSHQIISYAVFCLKKKKKPP